MQRRPQRLSFETLRRRVVGGVLIRIRNHVAQHQPADDRIMVE
jgi:hypothetical protein